MNFSSAQWVSLFRAHFSLLYTPPSPLLLPSVPSPHALHFLLNYAKPKETVMSTIKSYAAKEAGADLSLWEYDAGDLKPEDVEVQVEY